jgi:ammonia channel protein AmtB
VCVLGRRGGTASFSCFYSSACLLQPCQVGVIPVHLVAGASGVILVGFFAMDPSAPIQQGWPVQHTLAGVFHGGSGKLLGIQLLGAVFHAAWSGGERPT